MHVNITAEKIKEIAQDLETGMLCYYHVLTEELETVPDELKGHAGYDASEWRDVLRKIKANRTQYICFEGPESFESFRMMEHFAHDVTDAAIRNHLLESLSGKQPFSRFNQALRQYPDVLQQWYGFKNDQYIQLVQRQLDGYNLAEENK